VSIKVFYHSADLDGWCSGAIVKYKYPEAEMFPINYGDKFPWGEIKPDDVVYMVDFSLPVEEMDRLNNRLQQNFIWIDHHIGAIKDYGNMLMRYLPILGSRDASCAACELAWVYIFGSFSHVPKFIRLLSLYDTWNHNDEEFDWDFIEEFQYGFKARSRDPKIDMKFWEDRFHNLEKMNKMEQLDYVRFIADTGRLIKSYVEDRYRSEISTRSYKIDWEGYKCLVINSDPYIANFMTRSKEFEGCDIAVNYANKRGEGWIVNLRTLENEIDLSELAKKYKGGGHRSAAGFNCRVLPWENKI